MRFFYVATFSVAEAHFFVEPALPINRKTTQCGNDQAEKRFRIHLPNHSRISTVLCENFRMP